MYVWYAGKILVWFINYYNISWFSNFWLTYYYSELTLIYIYILIRFSSISAEILFITNIVIKFKKIIFLFQIRDIIMHRFLRFLQFILFIFMWPYVTFATIRSKKMTVPPITNPLLVKTASELAKLIREQKVTGEFPS